MYTINEWELTLVTNEPVEFEKELVECEKESVEIQDMFDNEEVGVQVLANVCGQLIEGYGDEVGALGRNILPRGVHCDNIRKQRAGKYKVIYIYKRKNLEFS